MNTKAALERAKRFVLRDMWSLELASLPRARKLAFRSMRTLSLAVHGFLVDKCALRAATLTLVFIFSLAPTLAVAFSIAKGFGVQDEIKPMVYGRVGLADTSMLDAIFEYVEQTDVHALGAIGLVVLFISAYKVLSSVEKTMNHIWGVEGHRKLVRRLVDYVAVIFVFPVMVMLTAIVTASFKSPALMQMLPEWSQAFAGRVLGMLLGVLFATVGFWFLYIFFPNIRVPFWSAVAGAVLAAVLWQILQWANVYAQVGAARFNKIYGTFAAVPIFILWLHLSWLIVLFGAEFSYAHANQKDLEFGGLTFSPSPAFRERLALGIMVLAGRTFMKETAAPTCEGMARRLMAPVRVTRHVIRTLIRAGLLAELQGDRPTYHPAVPPDQISLDRLFCAVQEDGDASGNTALRLERMGLERVLKLREGMGSGMQTLTLRDVLKKQAES